MKLLSIADRYIFREAFGAYLLGLSGFLLFLVINQIFLEWNLHFRPGVKFTELLLLVWYRVPFYTTLSIPIAVLFATLMSMGRLGKDNELTAMFTSGISLYRLFLPFLLLALPNVLLSFWITDQFVPWGARMSKKVINANPALRQAVREAAGERTKLFDPLITRIGDRYLATVWLNRNTGVTGAIIIDDLGGVLAPERLPEELFSEHGEREKGSLLALAANRETSPEGSRKEVRAEAQEQSQPEGSPEPAQGEIRVPPQGRRMVTLPAPTGEGGEVIQEARPEEEIERLGEAEHAGHRILFARSGKFDHNRLTLYSAWEYVTDDEGSIVEARRLGDFTLELERPLAQIYSQIKDPEELTRDELQTLVAESEELGLDTARAKTELYLKYSVPFAPLFLALIGMPLSLKAPRDERMLGLILTYVLVFVYYLIYFIFRLLGFNGIVHPLLAAWMHNIVYGVAAAVIFLMVRK